MEQPPNFSIMAAPFGQPCGSETPQIWESHRSEIEDLYPQIPLSSLMQHMEECHRFRKTIKQWKTQLGKWGLKKRVEGDEYKAILKKKRQREDEQPDKANAFILYGKVVPPGKIARYETEALRKGLIKEDDTFSQIATPPHLLCRTPGSDGDFSTSLDPMIPTHPEREGDTRLGLVARDISFDDLIFTAQSESPSIAYSDACMQTWHEPMQNTTQLDLCSPLRNPSLQAFDWWTDFAGFCSPQPTVLQVSSQPPLLQLLAPFARRAESYEDESVFRDLVTKTGQKCRNSEEKVARLINAAFMDFENPRKIETLVRAAIQKLDGLVDVSESRSKFLPGIFAFVFSWLGCWIDASSLFAECIHLYGHHLAHNNLALYRIRLAECYLALNQLDDVVAQLRHIFGPEFRRVVIPFGDSDTGYQPRSNFAIDFQRFDTEVIPDEFFKARAPAAYTENSEIPSGTFCWDHEIEPAINVDRNGILYHTLFFSTVRICRSDLTVIRSASSLVRELHRRNFFSSTDNEYTSTTQEIHESL